MKMSKGKRVLSLLLAVLLLWGTVGEIGPSEVLASDALFNDDFSTAEFSGWQKNDVGSIKSEKYYLSGHEANAITGIAETSGVMISADVMVNLGADESGLLQNSIASLVVMADETMSTGYEFGIGVTKTGDTYARLYLRGNEETTRILAQEYKDIPGTEKGTIDVGKEYKLSVGVYDGLIQCFINGKLALSYSDSTYTSGLCGIKTAWSKSSFDNVTVEKIAEKKVKKLTIENAPEKISLVGELDFDVVVEYEGNYHQTERLSSDDSRLTITGFKRTVGEKNVRVVFGGKAVRFKVQVVEKLDDTLVFSDTFTDFDESKYRFSNKKFEEYGIEYSFKPANGGMKATVPSIPSGFDSSMSTVMAIDTGVEKTLDHYYATIDAAVYDSIKTPTSRTGFAELSAFTDASGNAYRLRVYASGVIRLYCGSTTLYSKKIGSIEGLKFELGKTFNMTMRVSDNIIICQYNGVDVFYYADSDIENGSKIIKFGAYNGNVFFDNLKVYATETCSKDAVRGFQVRTLSDNTKVTSCTSRTFDIANYYLLVTYVDGVKRPVGLTKDMVAGYNPDLKQSQKLVITYGKKSVEFMFNYTEYLFYDDFEGKKSELWKFSEADNLKAAVRDGGLKISWNNNKDSAAFSATVQGSDKWDNYSVSADVAFNQDMTKSLAAGSSVNLMLRRTGTSYYDLRMVTRSGNISMTMYKYVNGTKSVVQKYTNAYIAAKLGAEKPLANGQIYNLKAICKGNVIYTYIDDILLGTYVDESSNPLLKGKVGFKASKISGTIDNFKVEEKGPRNFVRIGIEGVKDNIFELYEGFEIEAYNYKVNCYDSDGTVVTETLTDDMISPYDNLEAGLQNITITAHGLTQKAVVKVMQRDEYINALKSELEALNVETLSTSDVEKVDDILYRYDELSSYERTKLSEKANKAAAEARAKVEAVKYPELAEYDILYNTTFTDKEECKTEDWDKGFMLNRGEWQIINGASRAEQEYYAVSNSSVRLLKNVYGEISSVSARMKVMSTGMFAGVMLNGTSDGYYLVRLKMNVFDEEGKVIPMFQVLKGETIIISEELSNYGVSVQENEWFDIRLTYLDGIVSAYFNDTMVFSFDDSDEIVNFTEGTAGAVIWRGNGKFDNFTVRGVAKDAPTSVAKPTPTEYKDDFEGETVDANPDYWIEHPKDDAWKTYSVAGNTFYGTDGKVTDTNTWLHVFEKDPTATFDFMYDAKKNDSDFGFYVRMSPETAYVKVGYDVKTQKWYVTDTQAELDNGVFTTYSEKEYTLKENEWNKIKIVCSNNTVTVTVNDETVFDKHQVIQVGYGRIGVYTKDTALYIDNVACEFPNGDHVQDGLIEYTFSEGFYDAAVDVMPLDGDDMIGLGIYGSYYSKDNGLSFKVIGGISAAPEDVDPKYEAITTKGYKAITKIHDGSYLYLNEEELQIMRSENGTTGWEKLGKVVTEEERVDKKGRRLMIFHVNALTEVQLDDGTWRLFLPVVVTHYENQLTTSSCGHHTMVCYSDDGGVTWERSKNDTRDILINEENLGIYGEWAESKIIKCTDGTLRMYLTRAKYGCLQYTVSRDGGVTWEGHYQIPEMQVAKSSYNIIQDKEDGSYYLVFVNNSPVREGNTFSRTRLTLAHSKDGMNWEFLCDLERMSEEIYSNSDMQLTTPLMQFVDPSIEVDEDYVYITAGRSASSDKAFNRGTATATLNYHQALRPRMIRIEKDKLKARAWDASTVDNMLFPKSIEITKPSKVRFGYGDLFSYIGGEATVTRLDGTTETIDTARLYLYEEPDMFTLGKHTVVLYNKNGIQASYEIEVVNKYNVNWNITGDGIVEPKVNSVLEGEELSVEITPEDFFQKAVITVNDKRVRTVAGKLTYKEVTEDLNITVDFVQKGVIDYIIYIALGAVIVAGVTVTIITVKKRKKNAKLTSENES